ncbi:tRNA(Ile)(2)-agmatinylcytidine synthase [Halorussus limi]|uniref:tRNA(Ile2) 2-agmatinylcytidine synthetase TiaS n=1 Tax=Halorussus limi TaxID=2938695 RepID=A0A8U0HYS0_9EURY|nr:tRNA(Ile)(2)-agmatinylcytidine synthase [Halorussus limi]UPV75786.1 tRNA(Ile)(2)-agmatinylcytidine synthase [Halorussus limi]
MTVIGVDDTDSRELGMCTTYLAAEIAERVGEFAAVERTLLVRLNPAVEHKTRGNAALAVHTDADPEEAFEIAREEVARIAETGDPRTNPGLVVAPGDPEDVPDAVASFARDAVRDRLTVEDAEEAIEAADYRSAGWKVGRGRIGALAAVGAWAAFEGGDWTYECISYRDPERVGTPREVDAESVFDAANAAYPAAWDTVDRETGELVCVPHTPGPILHGIRGDDPEVVREVAEAIESEPVSRRALFVTNQGTDAHLRDADGLATVEDGRAYRVEGRVARAPETRRGGHVFLSLEGDEADDDARETLQCAAFEPTKRFRDRVRALRPGDRIAACGEVSDGTLKLEKFAVRDLNATELVTPDCPDCGLSMESAGAGQGYRCRDCKTTADGKVEREVDRDLELGWYEVPPEARRHIAKPLVRGGFDAPIHPEK